MTVEFKRDSESAFKFFFKMQRVISFIQQNKQKIQVKLDSNLNFEMELKLIEKLATPFGKIEIELRT